MKCSLLAEFESQPSLNSSIVVRTKVVIDMELRRARLYIEILYRMKQVDHNLYIIIFVEKYSYMHGKYTRIFCPTESLVNCPHP